MKVKELMEVLYRLQDDDAIVYVYREDFYVPLEHIVPGDKYDDGAVQFKADSISDDDYWDDIDKNLYHKEGRAVVLY